MYKWFPGTNGSHVPMVPMHKWFPRYKWFPGANGSLIQMFPRYKWFPISKYDSGRADRHNFDEFDNFDSVLGNILEKLTQIK
jgi:hypothetical protein